uniref:Proteasome alpha-type subunits domain-containing protein n=1 Tax=Brassica campestris TaxID=3711 RepID=M4FF23_BRACM
MDITRNNITKLHLQTQSLFPPNMERTLDVEPRMGTNPFAEDFIKSLPISSNQSSNSSSSEMVNERRQSFSTQKSIGEGRSSGQRRVMLMESPCTPGRGVFSFSSSLSGRRRRNFPSKWDDAEKWVTSSHESPAHSLKNHHILKDKLASEVPSTEGFIFRDLEEEEEEAQVQHRDMGTEMTPVGSVTTSRCHTPFESTSPARHNTPSNMSGPLTETKNVIDISEFANKLRLSGSAATQYYNSVTSHWNSREEEEEEISKSLRHSDMESELQRSVSVTVWDDEDDKIKFCQRYQREEAKIKAWVNLQDAKAEAQSRKLEVKIQKMRSNFEEKMMKRMDTVHRRAEDWRATARQQHAEQLKRAAETARKLSNRRGYLVAGRSSCGCLPSIPVSSNSPINQLTLTRFYRSKSKKKMFLTRSVYQSVILCLWVHLNVRPFCVSIPILLLRRTEYDRGVNTFSPEGRLFQVEYAIEAIKLGSTAIGVKTKEGVVLAVEKRITSPLLEPSSVEKIMEIDDHIGCAMSGLIADARTLVEHARVETQNHRFSYGEPMTVESTTQALCDLALRFGEGDEESMSRPFGVSLLIAGHDENGPSLYYTDPSGTFWQCNAKAIGSGSEGADSSLQEQFNKDLSLSEAETIAVSILKQVMEEKVTPNNVDIAKVAPAYHLYTPEEVEAVISRL